MSDCSNHKKKIKKKIIWTTPALDDSGRKQKGFIVQKVKYITKDKQ